MKAITFKVISHSLTLPSEMPAPLCQGQKSQVKTSLSRMNLIHLGSYNSEWAGVKYLHSFQRNELLHAYQRVRCEELKLSISIFDQDLASQEELT